MFINVLQFVIKLPRQSALWLILLYQRTLSPDHGWFKASYPYGYCRFYPTCSQYGYETIKKRGLLVGAPLTCWRIIRCNPWNQGGVDLPR